MEILAIKDLSFCYAGEDSPAVSDINITVSQGDFTVLAGMELHKQTVEDSGAYAQTFELEDNNYMWPDAATGVERATGIASGYTLASFFGKVDYNW